METVYESARTACQQIDPSLKCWRLAFNGQCFYEVKDDMGISLAVADSKAQAWREALNRLLEGS